MNSDPGGPKTYGSGSGFGKLSPTPLPIMVQCCGSMTFLVWIRIWIRGSLALINGSGFGVRIRMRIRMLFVIDLQDANIMLFCLLLFEGTFTSFSKIKKSQSSRNQGFSCNFCLVIEGSGSGTGSIPLTNGSGSGSRRPKNMDSDPDPQRC